MSPPNMNRCIFGLLLIYYLINNIYGQSSLHQAERLESLIHGIEGRQEYIAKSHVFKESILQLSSRDDLVMHDRVSQEYIHHVIFVIKQRNMEELTRILYDVSNPTSTNYGQHMSREQVVEMTSNPEARDAVLTYLDSKGASVISETLGGEYITASAPISVWESILNTEFYTFHQTQYNGRVDELVRAAKYSIPKGLDMHVESVFNTIQMPLQTFGELPQAMPELNGGVNSAAYDFPGCTTPAKLKTAYNLGTSQGSALSTQAAFATIGQYFSPADLSYFQSFLGLPSQAVTHSIGGYSSDSKCLSDSTLCSEGNLDIQYIMAMSPGSPTTFWYTDLGFSDWLITVANTANPPLVFSISYGAEESTVSNSEMYAFNIQAIKIGAMGTTLVAASGDDGAISRKVRWKGKSACSYATLFPASNPYVLSVGATSGIDSGTAEITCQSDVTGTITSGGGFSTYYTQPSYQTDAVAGYFYQANIANEAPYPGYNGGGRAYPDVAMAGLSYAVIIGQAVYKISGTSASAPTMAGLISNINAARLAVGKGSLGWINPALYANSASFVNDVTSGDTHCPANGPCCPHGFWAAPGWDPATGLGSVDYGKMKAVFLSLGFVNPLTSPTLDPSSRPTSVPTLTPSPRPTQSPSRVPTLRSAVPTVTPSVKPSTPTVAPTASPSNPTQTPLTAAPSLIKPSATPTSCPTNIPSVMKPSPTPTTVPTAAPTSPPSAAPSSTPSVRPSASSSPSFSTLSTFRVYHTASGGLTVIQASEISFFSALQVTVSTALGVPASAVTSISVAGNRRNLLASVGMQYTVTVNSGLTSDVLINKLQSSVTTGAFLQSLKARSGLDITGVSSLQIVNVSPTASPSEPPVSIYSGNGLRSILYVGIAGGAFSVLILIIVLVRCYCPISMKPNAGAEVYCSTQSPPITPRHPPTPTIARTPSLQFLPIVPPRSLITHPLPWMMTSPQPWVNTSPGCSPDPPRKPRLPSPARYKPSPPMLPRPPSTNSYPNTPPTYSRPSTPPNRPRNTPMLCPIPLTSIPLSSRPPSPSRAQPTAPPLIQPTLSSWTSSPTPGTRSRSNSVPQAMRRNSLHDEVPQPTVARLDKSRRVVEPLDLSRLEIYRN